MTRYIGKTKPATWHTGYDRPPVDTPDDFLDDDRDGGGRVITIIAFAIAAIIVIGAGLVLWSIAR